MINATISSKHLLTIKEASIWASNFLERDISESNISYLVQYGKINKHKNNNSNSILIDLTDLKNYYSSYFDNKELSWKDKLGNDLNWTLSFDNLREKDTTKHVHRLHPYKGKFIPQLVEYFIDDHIDNFKKNIYFKSGDILLDPFCGSGTTLVVSNELGMHSIGIDISKFNCTIAEVKMLDYDIDSLECLIKDINQAIINYESDTKNTAFEDELSEKMSFFNNEFFPSPEFKYKIQNGQIGEDKYAIEKEKEFLNIYNNLVKKYNIELNQSENNTFLDKWYIKNVRKEINYAFEQIKKIKDTKNKKALAVILSRTIRSCRATTHSDLATLKEPQLTTYYCLKHKKICKPIFSIKSWFNYYSNDTVNRIKVFSKIKTDAHYSVISGDSVNINIFKEIEKKNNKFYEILKGRKIAGIFTSPPYVGQIDYHEQHAYAYDLFGYERNDDLEIGPLYKGKSAAARTSYVDGISKVLLNCKKFLIDNFDIFIVANDKYNLYPVIVEKSGMYIAEQFKRPVLNRTERDKSPYSEIIFHLKRQK